MKRLSLFPFYILVFSIYPVLSLLGSNISQAHISVLWRPLLILSFSAILIIIILKFLYGNLYRASIATALLFFLFFTYGHIYNFLKAVEISGFLLGRHRILAPIWILFLILSLWWGKKIKNPEKYTKTLNLISAFLLIYPLIQITSYVWSDFQAQKTANKQVEDIYTGDLSLGYAPDIYYLILDAYGREDLLKEDFNYDNSEFLNYLEEKGFYVANCSQSNYAHTSLSLTSALNLNYLDTLTDDLNVSMDKNASLKALGQYNLSRNLLEARGYSTIAFATNFPFTEWTDADYFLSPPSSGMNSFELLLAQTSALRIPMDFITTSPEEQSTDWYRKRTVYALDYLDEYVPELSSPKFVYAHLVIPHHPFVFGANGEKLEYTALDITNFDEYAKGYNDQVTYINSRLKKMIDNTLEKSPNPPIIIIQGDHGPSAFGSAERRMKILNAYYFPNQPTSLYPQITPVNSFRIVFSEYFNKEYELLDDISYYSTFEDAYNFQEVGNPCIK